MTTTLRFRAAPYAMVPAWRRWLPLAQHEFMSMFRTRWGVAAYLLCLFPGLGRLMMLLIAFGVVNFGPPGLRARLRAPGSLASLDPHRVEFYVEPVLEVMPGMAFLLPLTALIVARSIARDRLTNALELYWTRGIPPASYLLAKWVGCTCLAATLTVLVPVALWLTAVMLAEDWSLLEATAGGMAQVAVGLALVTALWTAIGMLVSAVCRSPNTAMVAWVMLVVGSSAIAFVTGNVLREPWLHSCLSVWHAGGVLVRAIGGITQRGVSVPGACVVLGGLLLVLGLLARRRLRLAEAVA